MTVKQGQDINQKFTDLNNEISILKDSLSKKNIDIFSLNSEKTNLNKSLSLETVKKSEFEKENIDLKKLIKENESLYLSERKKWAGWMFFSVVMTVLVGALK